MPVKVALRTKDKVDKGSDELLKWIKDLKPGLHTEHWRVLNMLPELKGQRFILLLDQDSYKVIKETRYKIFIGLAQGTIMILNDPDANTKHEERAAMRPASL